MPESAPSRSRRPGLGAPGEGAAQGARRRRSRFEEGGFPPLAWYDVLLALRRSQDKGLRHLEIEAQLLLAQHNVSRLVDRLERAGLVERRPVAEDGRGQLVMITLERSRSLAPDVARLSIGDRAPCRAKARRGNASADARRSPRPAHRCRISRFLRKACHRIAAPAVSAPLRC